MWPIKCGSFDSPESGSMSCLKSSLRQHQLSDAAFVNRSQTRREYSRPVVHAAATLWSRLTALIACAVSLSSEATCSM